MKVCPSCNARLPEDASVCRSCDHQFDGEGRDQKQTMMGMPVVGDDDDQESSPVGAGFAGMMGGDDADADGESDSGEDAGGLGIDRSDLARALEKAREQDAAPPADDATRQVDPEAVEQLTGASGQHGDGAAAAWGLGEESSESVEAKTEVVDPDAFDFPESFDEDFSIADADEEPSPTAESESTDRDDDQFGTMQGMSVDEMTGQDGGGAAMQFGGGSDDGGGDDGSTQALSPDQLAEVEEMGFGAVGGDEEIDSGPSSGRLPMGTDSDDDDQKTAVVESPADAAGLRFPKPDDESDGSDLKPPETTGSNVDKKPGQLQAGSEEKPGKKQQKKRGTPRSGIFRAAKKKKKKTKPKTGAASDGDDDSSPDSQNLSDTGVTGTGTYSMSSNDTGGTSETPFEASDKDLRMGTVGAGGKTDFPAGAADDDPSNDDPLSGISDQESEPETAEESQQRPETGPVTGPSTGPAFAVGEEDSAGDQLKSPAVEPVGDASGDSASMAAPDDSSGESPEMSMEPLDDLEDPFDDLELEQAPAPDESPSELTPQTQQAPSSEEPTSESSPGDKPLSDPSPTQAAPESESDPKPEARSEQSLGFGAEPVADQPVAPVATPGEQPSPAPERTEDKSPSQPGGQQPSSQKAPEADDAAETSPPPQAAGNKSDDGLNIDKLVSLMQRGFGALAAVAMVVIAVVAVVLEGMPAGAMEIAVAVAPAAVAVVVLALTVVSMTNRTRSLGYAALGVAGVAGFAVVLVIGFSPLLAVAKLAGGALLLFAAAFPLIGNIVE